MGELSSTETEIVERAAAEPMLEQVLEWSAVNSGSRNLQGLERMAALLADAFSALPGDLSLESPAFVEAVDSTGRTVERQHGKHLHLKVRGDAPVQLLLTGHMDTVFGAEPGAAAALIASARRAAGMHRGHVAVEQGVRVLLAPLKPIPRLLVLAPRYPYPIIGGDRLRIHHVCAQLAERYRLTLLCFCDPSELDAPAPPDGRRSGGRA